MQECNVSMISYTKAAQAKRALQRYGYPSEIRRLEQVGPEGCGFALVVPEECSRVSELLTREGIPYRKAQTGRDFP